MQWLAMIMTFLFGRKSHKAPTLKEMAVEIFEEISIRSRRLVTLTLAALAAVIFFCGGFFISLLEATSQYDRVGYINFTATLAAGLGLIFLAALVFVGAIGQAWPRHSQQQVTPRRQEEAPSQPSALEAAFSALILDYVKERQLRREAKTHPSPSPMKTEASGMREEHPHQQSVH